MLTPLGEPTSLLISSDIRRRKLTLVALEEKGRIKVAGAMYHLSTGVVQFVAGGPSRRALNPGCVRNQDSGSGAESPAGALRGRRGRVQRLCASQFVGSHIPRRRWPIPQYAHLADARSLPFVIARSATKSDMVKPMPDRIAAP